MGNKTLTSLFRNQANLDNNTVDISGLVGELDRQDKTHDGIFAEAGGVSLESFGDPNPDQSSLMATAYEQMERTLDSYGFENYGADLGESSDHDRIKANQTAAGTFASMVTQDGKAGDYIRHLNSITKTPQVSNEHEVAIAPRMDGPFGTVPVLSTGLENYNEKSTRDFRVISVAYNLSAARQDPFGEAIYPTVVTNAAEGGVTQNVTYAAVMEDVYHQATGQKFDTREVNMVEAYRDPSILDDHSTTIVPIASDQNVAAQKAFVDDSVIPHEEVELEDGSSVPTAPLAIGQKFDLIGISNQQNLITGGKLDISDTIDPAITLKNIYVQIGTGSDKAVVKFVTQRIPTATFQPNLIGDTRDANLLFRTEDLVLSGEKTAVDGSTPAAITAIKDAGYNVRLSVNVNGFVSLSNGNTSITSVSPAVDKILNEDGTRISQTGADGEAIVTALGDMQVVGYDLDSRFTNTNRRERGMLVQTRTKQFRYPIPMHAPITLPMTTMDTADGPGEVVKALTVATNIRNSNNAVKRLLNYLSQLREVVGNGSIHPDFGSMEGALSVMMRPTYRYDRLDLRDVIDTLRSKDRWDDVCAAVLNKLKGMLYPAYRDSNIEAVFQTVSGNADERPKFIIACDKEIANYLMTKGDNRTLGAYLEYDIVSTNNQKFDGKLVVIPTRKNPKEGDILNFGQFYYVPTLIADLPISRHGQISREIAAIPFNIHINNIPFAIELDVLGLKEVMGSSSNQQLSGFEYPEDGGTDGSGSTGGTDDTSGTDGSET